MNKKYCIVCAAHVWLSAAALAVLQALWAACSDAGQENSDDNANVHHSAESNLCMHKQEEGLRSSPAAGRPLRTKPQTACLQEYAARM